MPVALIATPRAALRCRSKKDWRKIENDPDLAQFDQVPLTDASEKRIEAMYVKDIGVIDLREDMLIAADAPLISFVESADEQRYRLLLSDLRVSGMVTLSDLQKLPVYSLLFSLVIAVEMLVMEWIRAGCGPDEDCWLQYLDNGQRKSIEKHWNDAVRENLDIDRLSCASFGQELKAAIAFGLFHDQEDKVKELKAIERLRHQVFHGVDFAPTPEQALKIPVYVRQAQALVESLQDVIGKIKK